MQESVLGFEKVRQVHSTLETQKIKLHTGTVIRNAQMELTSSQFLLVSSSIKRLHDRAPDFWVEGFLESS